jgi:nicotinamidase/pyrazinamidase
MEVLIMVDVQNDFCPGGALAVPNGDAVVAELNQMAARVPFVVATRDWHPRDHGSFAAQGGPWPEHCVQGTRGAELHPQLTPGPDALIIDKGQARDRDGYSGFENPSLELALREHEATIVHIGGLALDYCVRATALDAARAGFQVVLHRGATRAVDVHDGDGERAVDDLRAAGVSIRD